MKKFTDSELLQLAAKAAGYEVIHICKGDVGLWLRGVEEEWNPLTDDCDSFRLMVKLGFRVYIYPGGGDYFTIVASDEMNQKAVWVKELHETNPLAATRRAIVRAAAELGSRIL